MCFPVSIVATASLPRLASTRKVETITANRVPCICTDLTPWPFLLPLTAPPRSPPLTFDLSSKEWLARHVRTGQGVLPAFWQESVRTCCLLSPAPQGESKSTPTNTNRIKAAMSFNSLQSVNDVSFLVVRPWQGKPTSVKAVKRNKASAPLCSKICIRAAFSQGAYTSCSPFG